MASRSHQVNLMVVDMDMVDTIMDLVDTDLVLTDLEEARAVEEAQSVTVQDVLHKLLALLVWVGIRVSSTAQIALVSVLAIVSSTPVLQELID